MRVTIPVTGESGCSRLLSFLMYLFSLFGILVALVGCIYAVDKFTDRNMAEVSMGVGIAAAGIVIVRLPYAAYYYINWRIGLSRLKMEVKEKGLEPMIVSSVQIALRIYSKSPGRAMLSYIKSLNPEAAEMIRAEESKGKRAVEIITNVSRVCLAIGMIFLVYIFIYESEFAYSYEDMPIDYKKYEKDLTIGTYAEINIYEATPIGTKTSNISNKNGKQITSSLVEGVYYHIIDDKGQGGLVFLPSEKIGKRVFSTTVPLGNDYGEYNIDTPLQVYGCIKETPSFAASFDPTEILSYADNLDEYREQRSKKDSEFNEWISEYALLEVDSLTPLTQEIRIGEGIGDSWKIFMMLLIVIPCCLLGSIAYRNRV